MDLLEVLLVDDDTIRDTSALLFYVEKLKFLRHFLSNPRVRRVRQFALSLEIRIIASAKLKQLRSNLERKTGKSNL